jgi:hypothetical protein
MKMRFRYDNKLASPAANVFTQNRYFGIALTVVVIEASRAVSTNKFSLKTGIWEISRRWLHSGMLPLFGTISHHPRRRRVSNARVIVRLTGLSS